MNEKDTYKTIIKATEEILFKEKNSKFYGYAFPIATENDVKISLEIVKKQHRSARHFCYAYQIGTQPNKINYRVNDDGEPNNSAGLPIYGQIQSFNLTNVFIVVVRYFGGIKLGVGGLISAYKTTAKMVLENASIVDKTINIEYSIFFDYKNMNSVMRIIKEKKLAIVEQQLELNCEIIISVRKSKAENIESIFKALHEVKLKQVES